MGDKEGGREGANWGQRGEAWPWSACAAAAAAHGAFRSDGPRPSTRAPRGGGGDLLPVRHSPPAASPVPPRHLPRAAPPPVCALIDVQAPPRPLAAAGGAPGGARACAHPRRCQAASPATPTPFETLRRPAEPPKSGRARVAQRSLEFFDRRSSNCTSTCRASLERQEDGSSTQTCLISAVQIQRTVLAAPSLRRAPKRTDRSTNIFSTYLVRCHYR